MKNKDFTFYVVIILIAILLGILQFPLFLRDTAYVRDFWLK